jgi:putative two-component system response regulator
MIWANNVLPVFMAVSEPKPRILREPHSRIQIGDTPRGLETLITHGLQRFTLSFNRTAVNEDMDQATILIVDDEPANLTVLTHVLQSQYRVRAVNSGERALQVAATAPRPDLILLDVMMPGMDGHAVLTSLKGDAATCDIPVIFVTAMDSTEDEQHGLELGAVDYITKPLRAPIVLARVHTHLTLKRASDWLKDQNAVLDAEVKRRMEENQLFQDVSIHALAELAETRDPETGNHIRRTQAYVAVLADQLRSHPRFQAALDGNAIPLLTKSAPLHDIGKVGIPDTILLKPGALTPLEWVVMKTHAKLGADAIERAERDTGKPVTFLAMAKEIAHWHHEKWDGSGYPDGLKGEAIPMEARLMALADVFDALISIRVYKPALSFDESYEIILQGRGKHFDPDVVDAFLARYGDFVAIARQFLDESPTSDDVLNDVS